MKNLDKLDHKSYLYKDLNVMRKEMENLCHSLDQKHPMERKIRFLLDIRGYLKVNDIKGSYIEFGSYRSEMQYAAFHILKETNLVNAYVGLDTFTGEPELTSEERKSFPVMHKGDFGCNYDGISNFVNENFDGKGFLVRGDFRDKEVINACNAYLPISVAVIDCNLLSSTEFALDYVLKNMVSGGLIFIDDYLSNFNEGIPRVPNLLDSALKNNKRSVLIHNFYSPFAKSFIIINNL